MEPMTNTTPQSCSKTSGARPTCASSATSAPAPARSCPSPTCSPARSTSGRRRSAFATPASPSPDDSLDYCSGCGVCTLVCPHGVKVMEINTAAKAELRKRSLRRHPFDSEVVAQLAARPQRGAAASWVARWRPGESRRWGPGRCGCHGKDGRGIHRDAPFPNFHFTKFRGWFFGRST